jgi:NAD(P)-dependent dehydrogenase (short-subunit alcohol dehydrogenase family)
MRTLIVGATGTLGAAVAVALAQRHELLRASRRGELTVDIADTGTIRALYERVGSVDAVVACAGDAAFKPLRQISDDDLALSIQSKLLGQINLVRLGIDFVRDNGVFVLTAGSLAIEPMPGAPVISMVNGAIESFARAAALELPRGLRIGAVSPPFLHETAQRIGMPQLGRISAVEAARAYVAVVAGDATGTVSRPGRDAA